MPQMPTVGRIVHYVSYGTPNGVYRSECRAAVITEALGPGLAVGLAVLNPAGLFFRSLAEGGCCYHGGVQSVDRNGEAITEMSYHGGTWHWPERA